MRPPVHHLLLARLSPAGCGGKRGFAGALSSRPEWDALPSVQRGFPAIGGEPQARAAVRCLLTSRPGHPLSSHCSRSVQRSQSILRRTLSSSCFRQTAVQIRCLSNLSGRFARRRERALGVGAARWAGRPIDRGLMALVDANRPTYYWSMRYVERRHVLLA